MATIDEIRDMKRTYLERIQKDGRAEILRIAAEAIEKDGVDRIQWEQYTPYFNDGDECVFSVHGVRAYDADSDEEITEYKYKKIDGEWKRVDMGRSIPNIETFNAVLQELSDMAEIVFGNHVQVTIHRDGTMEVEEYNHD